MKLGPAHFTDVGFLIRDSGMSVLPERDRKGSKWLIGWSLGWTQSVTYVK